MSSLPTVHDCLTMNVPKIPDVRGNLTYIESAGHVPFSIRRVYWIYDVPGGEVRGGHAYRELQEFIIALSGSFDVHVNDGDSRRVITLNRSYYGLYVPRMMWRQLVNLIWISGNSKLMHEENSMYKIYHEETFIVKKFLLLCSVLAYFTLFF